VSRNWRSKAANRASPVSWNPSEFYDLGTSQTADDVEEDGEGAASRDERGEAYLREKNRVLADRVETLEATLEGKDDRIAALEAMVERLKNELNATETETDTEAERGDESASSVWGRTKGWFESD